MGILTVRDLRHLLGHDRHKITYAIDRHGPEPAGVIGTTRFWNETDLPAIVASIDQVAAGRQGFRRTTAVPAGEAPP
jgi:hypothetical protein